MRTGLFIDSMSVVSHRHFAVIKLSNQNQSQKQPLLILLLPLTEKHYCGSLSAQTLTRLASEAVLCPHFYHCLIIIVVEV